MNYIKIIKNHKLVAEEHCLEYGLNHTPTYRQAILMVLRNLFKGIRYKEINGNYIAYDTITKDTLGLKTHLIISLYVKKEDRGQGVASMLLDICPKPLINSKGTYEIGRLYKVR